MVNMIIKIETVKILKNYKQHCEFEKKATIKTHFNVTSSIISGYLICLHF